MAKYSLQDIPYQLQKPRQWVLWSYEERDGKLTKVPKQVDGHNASPTNPRTWSSFSAAKHVMEEYGFEGIGFVFSTDDDFIGIDLDKCVDEKGEISEFAKSIIDKLDSYTEFSPSGKGIHIIIKGTLPDGFEKGRKNDKLGIEIYSQRRFFTFTGNRENENDVFDRSDEILELIDEIFELEEVNDAEDFEVSLSEYTTNEVSNIWERMFKSARGEEIKRMFDGELIVNNDHSGTDQALCNHLAFWTSKNPSMMDYMFRQSGLMRDKWDEMRGDDTYGNLTIKRAIKDTKETIGNDKEGIIKIKESSNKRYMFTELGNAEWFAAEYNEKVLFNPQLGWMIWNGKKWELDDTGKVEILATKLFKKIFAFAPSSTDEKEAEDEKKFINKWGMASQSRRVITNSLLLAKAMLPVKMEQLDTNKYLFNVQNGIIDLKTGTLLPHAPQHLITKIAQVGYEKEADCPSWQKFLESVLVDIHGDTDHELIRYMQKVIGYSLTGDISEQSMFFLFGGGKNGKSTFINTVKDILGDFAKQTNKETFIARDNKNGTPNSDVARLAGSRFVSAIESNEGEKLDESIVKQVTGGEDIVARFLHKDFFEFTPEFKVFFTTNHKPIVKGTDDGIWRRIKLIPFMAHIPEEKRDLQLSVKLREEMPGILNWMIEGCLLWQKEGLQLPNAVQLASDEYKEEMDIVLPFIKEQCVINPLAKVAVKDLYDAYTSYCYQNEEFKLKKRSFLRFMESKGFKKERGAKNQVYLQGVDLNETAKKAANYYKVNSR